MFGIGRLAATGLAVFLLTLAPSFAGSSGAAEVTVDGWPALLQATDEEVEALFSASLPDGYPYTLPDAVHVPFQSPYPPSPVPDAEELAVIRHDAENGNTEAQLSMGHFYINGDAVGRDLATGAAWYRKAAEQGNARAQHYLGFLYECGTGVERNYAEAFRWYLKAVDQDDPAAHLAVAGFHFTFRKQFMPMHFGRYVNWRMKAAYLIGDPGPERPSLEECIWNKYHSAARFYQNDSVLAEILRQKAVAGDFEATLTLAKAVHHAQGVSRDPELTQGLILSAAGQGSDAAAYILGAVSQMGSYTYGKGEKDKEAFLAVAARRNRNPFFVYTVHNIALMKDWDVHRGMPAEEMRLHWQGLRNLADQGYAPAQLEVAEHIIRYRYNRDTTVAEDLLEKASDAGYVHAKRKTGVRMLLGIGIRQNVYRGKRLLDEAFFSNAADDITLPAEYFVDRAQLGRIKEAESVLNSKREAGDLTSIVYLGGLNEVTSRGEKPLDLYLETFEKGLWPTTMVIKNFVRLKSGKRGFSHHLKPGEEVDPRAVMLDEPPVFCRKHRPPGGGGGVWTGHTDRSEQPRGRRAIPVPEHPPRGILAGKVFFPQGLVLHKTVMGDVV